MTSQDSAANAEDAATVAGTFFALAPSGRTLLEGEEERLP